MTEVAMKVPRSRIPQVAPTCPRCDSGTKAKFGTPFADGYYRRHQCLNPACEFGFYSLASYVDNTFIITAATIKDRPLTPDEVMERMSWWEEDMKPVHHEAPLHRAGMPATVQRLMLAMAQTEEERKPPDKFLVNAFREVIKRVEILDAAQPKELVE